MKLSLLLSLILFTGICLVVAKPIKKGFDLENATIPLKDIKDGGPRRDGIPSIDKPAFLSIAAAGYLKDEDLVMSVSHRGTTRAYPIRILNYHEIVNDSIDDLFFSVTYCPLCGTGMVFNREIEGEVTTFGVSGLLYQSDVLLYDRASESLWTQLRMRSVAGSRVGQQLEWLASEFMTWVTWKERYKDGEVFFDKTGQRRNYRTTPYVGYEKTDRVYFPVPHYRDDLGIKHKILGIDVGGTATAYDLDIFIPGKKFVDKVGDRTIHVSFNSQTQHAVVVDVDSGDLIPHVFAFWFAWQAFYPETRLFSFPKTNEENDGL
jgi:hypothetical protein